MPQKSVATSVADSPGDLNEVRLVGRVSGSAETRLLPSGDEIVVFRLVVRRPPESPRGRRAGSTSTTAARPPVDTFDVACWTAGARRVARRLADGETVEVTGALRRRFYRAGPAVQSRYDVVAAAVRRSKT